MLPTDFWSGMHQGHITPSTWNLPELFSSWSSKRNQWECKLISRRGMVIPQTGRVILMIKQHASLLLRNVPFSPCSLLQWTDITLHTLTTTDMVSLSFSSKGTLKENISQHHIIIFMMIAREIFCYAVEAAMTWSVQVPNFWTNSQQSCP